MEFRTILGKASPLEKGKFLALADSSLASSSELARDPQGRTAENPDP